MSGCDGRVCLRCAGLLVEECRVLLLQLKCRVLLLQFTSRGVCYRVAGTAQHELCIIVYDDRLSKELSWWGGQALLAPVLPHMLGIPRCLSAWFTRAMGLLRAVCTCMWCVLTACMDSLGEWLTIAVRLSSIVMHPGPLNQPVARWPRRSVVVVVV